MPEPERTCPQCGGATTTAARCPRCGADVPPPLPEAAKPPAIETWFEGPDRPAWEPPATPELEILDEPEPDEVPVVLPAARPGRVESLPEARPLPAGFPRPARDDEPVERPRPQIALAMTVLLLLALATCAGAFVLVYAIWAGFKRMAPKRADVPADVRPVPALRGAPAAR